MEPEAEIMSFVAQDLRNEFGPSVIMERILPQVDEFIQVSHVVIDGVRQIEEMERLQFAPQNAGDRNRRIRGNEKKRVIERSRSDDGGFEERSQENGAGA